MRSKIIVMAAAAVVVGTAGAAANGDDEYSPAPPPDSGREYVSERYDWSGVYLGVQGGWLWGRDEAFEVFTETGVVDEGPLPYDTDGYAVGGVLGLNLQSGIFVYGGEVDIEYADFSGQWNWDNGDGLTKDINILGSLRARVGVALDRILVYGTGGLAVGDVDMVAFDGPDPVISISGNETPFGYAVGGGVEVGLWGNWSADAEYRYTNLGDTEHSGDIACCDLTFPHSDKFHAVRARVVYRLGI